LYYNPSLIIILLRYMILY